jgi:hypothetical protein
MNMVEGGLKIRSKLWSPKVDRSAMSPSIRFFFGRGVFVFLGDWLGQVDGGGGAVADGAGGWKVWLGLVVMIVVSPFAADSYHNDALL